MPLNAVGWSSEEEEQLINLVKPHPFLYDIQDPSRNNLITRENSWKEIALKINKPVEECRKRWRGLRDGYMRRKRVGSRSVSGIIDRLSFLDNVGNNTEYKIEEPIMLENLQSGDDSEVEEQTEEVVTDEVITDEIITDEVITDGYYEVDITMVEPQSEDTNKQPPMIKILPKLKNSVLNEAGKVKRQKTGGRKRSIPMNMANLTPVKILPKPFVVTADNVKNVITYQSVDDKSKKAVPAAVQTKPQMRINNTETVDRLIERVLQESTNEVDIFFRSMAASVKKLSPTLIPKIKMEVCNVIAKYEMQNFEKFKKK